MTLNGELRERCGVVTLDGGIPQERFWAGDVWCSDTCEFMGRMGIMRIMGAMEFLIPMNPILLINPIIVRDTCKQEFRTTANLCPREIHLASLAKLGVTGHPVEGRATGEAARFFPSAAFAVYTNAESRYTSALVQLASKYRLPQFVAESPLSPFGSPAGLPGHGGSEFSDQT